MINVEIITVGKLKERYLTEGIEEYAKRLSRYCKLKITELAEYRLPAEPSEAQIAQGLYIEGDAILQRISSFQNRYVISLCVEGQSLSSEQLAQTLSKQAANGSSNFIIVIGSSFGLSEQVKQASDFKLSLSKLTFPHQLVRLMLAEQLYRVFTIMAGGKYHK